MKRKQTATLMNKMGREKIPFLFILDFDLLHPIIQPLHKVNTNTILFDFNGKKNHTAEIVTKKNVIVRKFPVSFDEYCKAFEVVMRNLRYGNSYLTNLTFPTRIVTDSSLKEVFYLSKARYKVWFNDLFTVFSPEIFVRIRDGRIYSHPMKGTIDALIPDAEKIILGDTKEEAEHYTIVDLIRNDLSVMATNVKVDKFRYVERLALPDKDLLQVSSVISGDMPIDYALKIGDLLVGLLPAGSVSGAPKKKTVEIIHKAETYQRGYYTGVAGYFDGLNLDSGVMIRFIEKQGDNYFFKSGGGITVNSDPEKEYRELIDKVDVPIV